MHTPKPSVAVQGISTNCGVLRSSRAQTGSRSPDSESDVIQELLHPPEPPATAVSLSWRNRLLHRMRGGAETSEHAVRMITDAAHAGIAQDPGSWVSLITRVDAMLVARRDQCALSVNYHL